MNILEFINSKDVKEYLVNINYNFSLIDKVFIINNSKKSIKDKIEAYNEIINGNEDIEVKERINIRHYKSLREFLRLYIDKYNETINDFYINKNNDYIYLLYYDNHSYLEHTFKNYEDVIKYIKDNKEKNKYRIEKNLIGDDKTITMRLNNNLDIIEVSGNIDEILFEIDGLWVDIPTPFKKGNIVTCYNNEPFVLDWIINQKKDKYYHNMKKHGDSSDMIAYGYFIDDNNIYYECIHNYLDLEYYEDKSDVDKYNMLNHISLYLKDEISLDYLLNYTDLYKSRINKKEYEKSLDWYLKKFELKE